jgi:hypothetical protein
MTDTQTHRHTPTRTPDRKWASIGGREARMVNSDTYIIILISIRRVSTLDGLHGTWHDRR